MSPLLPQKFYQKKLLCKVPNSLQEILELIFFKHGEISKRAGPFALRPCCNKQASMKGVPLSQRLFSCTCPPSGRHGELRNGLKASRTSVAIEKLVHETFPSLKPSLSRKFPMNATKAAAHRRDKFAAGVYFVYFFFSLLAPPDC